jgi:spore cortex formation protein SpoVR/YcgB (stage V sporulation)
MIIFNEHHASATISNFNQTNGEQKMNINLDELGKKLHAKLDRGIEQLKSAKARLENFQKETEAAIETKIDAGKKAIEEKKKEAATATKRLEAFVEEKRAETESAIAEWKANHDWKKLEKRAERAEKQAEASIAVALYAAEEAELAILEAVAARKDADEAAK